MHQGGPLGVPLVYLVVCALCVPSVRFPPVGACLTYVLLGCRHHKLALEFLECDVLAVVSVVFALSIATWPDWKVNANAQLMQTQR